MIFSIEMEDVMKELHKRSPNPKYKKKYRVTNWKEYEQSLCNRGSLTIWIPPSVIKSWKNVHQRSKILNRFLELGCCDSMLVA